MVNSRDKMKKKNWTIFFIGLFLFILGFILLAFIGDKPEGILGFITPITVLSGIIIITFGFLAKE